MPAKLKFDGRAGVWYQRDTKKMRIDGELLADGTRVIDTRHRPTWEPPHDEEKVSDEEWGLILREVEAFLRAKKAKYEMY